MSLEEDTWAEGWLDRHYGGAPDECSACYRDGSIVKIHDCKDHNSAPEEGTMSEKQRVKFEVWVDLDPTPGTFHSKESARNTVDRILKERIPHYKPTVSTTGEISHLPIHTPEEKGI